MPNVLISRCHYVCQMLKIKFKKICLPLRECVVIAMLVASINIFLKCKLALPIYVKMKLYITNKFSLKSLSSIVNIAFYLLCKKEQIQGNKAIIESNPFNFQLVMDPESSKCCGYNLKL